MHLSRLTKPTRLIAGLLCGLLLAILAVPLGAQPASTTHAYYDVTKEITVSGTVTSVVTRASAGMVPGSHLMLTTESGALDASLGKWALQGKGAVSISAGQQVEVTGVKKTLKNKEVFVTRTLKVGGQVYELRSKHGVPFSPQSRERASQKAAQKGESL
jgi:hypothetical protein